MRSVGSDRSYCGKIQDYLDAYLNSELLVETTHQVLSHLESCRDCKESLRSRERVKSALRLAVGRESATEALKERIRRIIRG